MSLIATFIKKAIKRVSVFTSMEVDYIEVGGAIEAGPRSDVERIGVIAQNIL